MTHPDGSSTIFAVGGKRFKVVSSDALGNDYYSNLIEYLVDEPVEQTEKTRARLIGLHDKVRELALSRMSVLPQRSDDKREPIGKMPEPEIDWMTLPNGPAWIWWLAEIIEPFRPMVGTYRYYFVIYFKKNSI